MGYAAIILLYKVVFFFKIFIYFYFTTVDDFPACTSVHHRHTVPWEGRRGLQIPPGTDRCKLPWVLGSEPQSSGKAGSAPNH